MKSIIFTLALTLPIAVNAQREYSSTYDDLYAVDETNVVVYDYDEVVNEQKSVKNVLVRHNQETNYFHEDVVSENHYIINDSPTVRRYKRVYNYSPSRYYYIEPSRSYIRYNECRYDYKDKWYFFFDIGTSHLINREEMAHLIDYALFHPYLDLHIDSYSDFYTGSRRNNMILSQRRSDSIVKVLLKEGVNRNRIYVVNHGCDKQPYYTNDYNRCVIVTLTYRK